MGSGVLQLASYGRQENLFYKKPTITYFKTMYKRHTNFVTESIPQQFNIKPDFGKKVTCVIGDIADLIGQIYLNINLPPIGQFLDVPNESGAGNSNIANCAWGNKIGYRIIKNIEFELNDKVIEKHTSDWFNVYNEMNNYMSHDRGINEMIGNVEELYSFTSSKNGYLLSIPLIFWFNKFPNLAFPIVAAYNTTVKINVEFNTLDNCLLLGPTHYVTVDDDICLFNKEDILYQNINGKLHYMKFIYYDIYNKRLYYIKVTNEKIVNGTRIYSFSNKSYSVLPTGNERLYLDKRKYFNQTLNLALGSTYLLVDYIFLDIKEKRRFIKNKLDYVIGVLQYDNEKNIYHTGAKMKINYSHPTTELIFNCSQEYLQSGYMKDIFNYSESILNRDEIVNVATLYMNGQERFAEKKMVYYNKLQAYLYHKNNSPVGIGSYSFSIDLNNYQPAGYCNLTKVPDIELKLKMNRIGSYDRPIKFRIYATTLRRLVIENGICTLE